MRRSWRWRWRWYRLRDQPRRFKAWFLDPFVVHHDFYEHTHVEHRAFPYRLRVTVVESLQERLDRGGVIVAAPGVHHLTVPLEVWRSDTTIVGAHLRGHGAEACISVPFIHNGGPPDP